MLAGKLYKPLDKEFSDDRIRTRLQIKELNDTRENEVEEGKQILKKMIPGAGADLWQQLPFHYDYGSNMKMGDKVIFNFNCMLLDVAPVTIGSRTLCGPSVQVYTATHPLIH